MPAFIAQCSIASGSPKDPDSPSVHLRKLDSFKRVYKVCLKVNNVTFLQAVNKQKIRVLDTETVVLQELT